MESENSKKREEIPICTSGADILELDISMARENQDVFIALQYRGSEKSQTYNIMEHLAKKKEKKNHWHTSGPKGPVGPTSSEPGLPPVRM
jgi:hypothetical protein